MFVLTIIAFLVTYVQAYSKFLTICTAPSSTTNFVLSPDTRGTLDILWSCFFTIIACTWTIQHLNVPEQPIFDSRELPWYKDWWWKLRGFRRTLKWMLVTIFAPEYILGKAVADFYAASRSRREMQTYAETDKVEWGLTHAFFANMGGFVLTQNCGERDSNANDPAGRRETEALGVETDVEKEASKHEPTEVEPKSTQGYKDTGGRFSYTCN